MDFFLEVMGWDVTSPSQIKELPSFLSSTVPAAVSKIPGSGELMKEVKRIYDDIGIADKPAAKVLSSITDEGGSSVD